MNNKSNAKFESSGVRILILGAVLLLAAAVFAVQAFASGIVDVNHDVSLLVHFTDEDASNKGGFHFNLYRVADVSEDAKYTKVGAFEAYDGDVNDVYYSDKEKALTDDLNEFVEYNNVKPDITGTSDNTGAVSFGKNEGLRTGMYLLNSDVLVTEGATYTTKPSIVLLPSISESGTPNYDITVVPKQGKITPDPEKQDDGPSYTPGNKLPQTGMLLWPAAMLTAGGLLCILIGVRLRTRKSRKDRAAEAK